MSDETRSASEAMERLRLSDSTLKSIRLTGMQHTDAELAEVVDCLLAHPDVVKEVYLGGNRLTDEMGVKLARYIAVSSTVQTLGLSCNQVGTATYLAVVAALRVNSSLRELSLYGNQAVDQPRIEAAFVEALRLNPDRPAESDWRLFSPYQNDIKRLRDMACELGHPSLQLLLAVL